MPNTWSLSTPGKMLIIKSQVKTNVSEAEGGNGCFYIVGDKLFPPLCKSVKSCLRTQGLEIRVTQLSDI